jgi:hypothetical protein
LSWSNDTSTSILWCTTWTIIIDNRSWGRSATWKFGEYVYAWEDIDTFVNSLVAEAGGCKHAASSIRAVGKTVVAVLSRSNGTNPSIFLCTLGTRIFYYRSRGRSTAWKFGGYNRAWQCNETVEDSITTDAEVQKGASSTGGACHKVVATRSTIWNITANFIGWNFSRAVWIQNALSRDAANNQGKGGE